jgi:hypothetical protein
MRFFGVIMIQSSFSLRRSVSQVEGGPDLVEGILELSTGPWRTEVLARPVKVLFIGAKVWLIINGKEIPVPYQKKY